MIQELKNDQIPGQTYVNKMITYYDKSYVPKERSTISTLTGWCSHSVVKLSLNWNKTASFWGGFQSIRIKY